jgi:hypothetical protein
MAKHLTSKDILKKGDSATGSRIEPVDDKALMQADEIELMNPEELFGDSGTESNQNSAKELFNPKNPKIKTELTQEQIMIMSRLYPLSKKYYEVFGCYMLKLAMDEMILESISKDRASRKEFVTTNSELMKQKDMSMLGKMFGQNQM